MSVRERILEAETARRAEADAALLREAAEAAVPGSERAGDGRTALGDPGDREILLAALAALRESAARLQVAMAALERIVGPEPVGSEPGPLTMGQPDDDA